MSDDDWLCAEWHCIKSLNLTKSNLPSSFAGIYRICGSQVRKNLLKDAFENNSYLVELGVDHVPDINVITSEYFSLRYFCKAINCRPRFGREHSKSNAISMFRVVVVGMVKYLKTGSYKTATEGMNQYSLNILDVAVCGNADNTRLKRKFNGHRPLDSLMVTANNMFVIEQNCVRT